MRTLISFSLALLTFTGSAADWYVDSTASGSNNGTNWANAWTGPTNVVWGASGVKAGDTLWIGGGPYTNSYFVVGAGGSSNNWITIATKRDSFTDPKIQVKGFNLNGYQWIKITGVKDTNWPLPYPGALKTNLSLLTTNIGLQITHLDQGATSQGIYVNGASGANQWVEWTEFGPIGADVDTNAWDCFGIRFLNLTTNGNWTIRGNWFHDIKNDNINLNAITGQNPDTFDATIIEHNYLQGGGDDGTQWSRNGLTFRFNYCDGHMAGIYQGHPDHLQLAGVSQRYFKIINNVFNDNGNSIIKAEMLATEGGVLGDMIVAGNYFYGRREVTNYTFGEPIGFQAWRENADTNVNFVTQSNVYFLNNTFYWLKAGSGLPWFIGRAAPTGGTRSVWVINAYNGWFANNIAIDMRWNAINGQSAMSWSGDGVGGGPTDTNGIYYSSNQVRWINNSISGTEKSFRYAGTQWTNGEALGMGNVSTQPKLLSTNSYDFRLDTNDTVAIGTGYNWSTLDSLTNNHPELMLDLFGNPRFRSGVVDRGAASLLSSTGGSLETNAFVTDGLLLWINFDQAPATDDDGYPDLSGNGNHGRHLGYMNAHSTSNRCPDQIQWTNTAAGGRVETGAKFRRYRDMWDEYNNSGDYLGVTNRPSTNELWSMRTASIMFWGRYDSPDPSHPDYTNTWNAEGNRRFIGAGYGYPGAWTIGLGSDGKPQTCFRIYPNTSATTESKVYFTDRINIVQGPTVGTSTNMRHYLVTWTNGVAQGFLNGVLNWSKTFTNSTGANVSNLTVRGPSGGRSGMIQIGGDTHNANPLLTYLDTNNVLRGDDGNGTFYEVTGAKQVPNHGWAGFSTMDDVRIYNRVLTTNEIWMIYSGAEGSAGSGGSGPTNPPPSAPGIRITTASLNVRSNATINQVTSP